MIVMRTFSVIMLVLLMALPVYQAQAQQFQVVAIVNGEGISNYKLADRIALMIQSSGLPDTKETREKIMPQALQLLINETLQQQHAEEIGIRVTDGDMTYAIADLERKNGVNPGDFDKFLESQGVNKDALMEQIKRQLLWKKIIAARIQPQIYVGDFEVDDAIAQVKQQPTSSDVLLAEIVVGPSGDDAEQARILAYDLMQQVEKGADFETLATQFSIGSTAQDGGIIGWIKEEQLTEPVKSKVAGLKSGEMAGPFKSEDGYRIIYLKERRIDRPGVDRKQIEEQLAMQKLDLESRRYMKKIRETAYIEVRL